ncbi:MAG: ABC transporter substrate-binding protein [Kiritimatiellae bacterium]|nr:ABC transporter substrate-binding protein [Kiritimatiellia bacterium]
MRLACAAVVVALALASAGVVAVAEPSDAEPVKIGAIFAVTGPASFLGAPEAKTAEMLVEQINAQGGVLGRELKVIVKDSGGNPQKAVSFAKQLIEEDKVLAIIGPSTSGETLQIKPICEEEGMILISCAAAELIVKPVAKYVFKTPQKDSQAATWIFKTMNEKGIKKIGVVSGNTGFGKAGKEQLEALAPEFNIQIVANEVYDQGATDLTDILTKLRAAGVEAVVNWSIVPAQSIIPKNMAQLGMNVPLFQSHGFGNPKYVEQAGKAAEGILFPCGRLLVADVLPENHPQKQVLSSYKNDYEKRYQEDVSTFGGHAYDALMLAVKAIEKAATTDRAAVRDAIENMKGFVGTGGVFNFSPQDHNGLDLDAFEMLTVRNGKMVLLK